MTRKWAVTDALESARESAVHLEMRDSYLLDDPEFIEWRAGTFDVAKSWAWWLSLVSSTVGRGVTVRRARIVSEPVTEYIRFEHDMTAHNIGAGEDVRWLPRRLASDIALPGNDYWLFDGKLAIFNHFDGNGNWLAESPEEIREEPGVVALCATAFAAVWERATPHADYQLI